MLAPMKSHKAIFRVARAPVAGVGTWPALARLVPAAPDGAGIAAAPLQSLAVAVAAAVSRRIAADPVSLGRGPRAPVAEAQRPAGIARGLKP